jgi:hypothetical protein
MRSPGAVSSGKGNVPAGEVPFELSGWLIGLGNAKEEVGVSEVEGYRHFEALSVRASVVF